MVNPLPNAAGTITGPTTLCAGSTANYSVAPILNALSYSWTVPAGASITSGAGTNNITVSFGTNASSGDITVAGVNNCGTGVPSSLAVTVNPLPGAAGAINGPTSVCQGQSNVTFSVAPIPNATSYVWSVPSGVSITSGANTNTIKVTFTEGAASGNFSVYGTNACGNGTPSPNFYVTVNPIPPTPTITLDGNTLISSAPNGNQWYRNNTPIPGATQQTYVVTESGSYYVVVTLNGCSSAPSNIIEVTITGMTVVDETAFSIFPNPNNGQFTINVNIPGESEFHLVLFNSIGEKIWEQKGIRASEKWTQHFDMNTLRPGIYNAVLFNDKTQITRRVIIQR
ncbi:MAG: T9SS type A sorting domain-containing protein, partial [Bacteroidales bacterium]|nr:T9SS type A sorting domain-containing protein [Bacteroidales bacterium]